MACPPFRKLPVALPEKRRLRKGVGGPTAAIERMRPPEAPFSAGQTGRSVVFAPPQQYQDRLPCGGAFCIRSIRSAAAF